ncbi:MAG: 3-hydroxyacyl-ACP dehydratase [Bacteroidaceae bacterium]|jgi:3-hydroxyacyl-[acyl-carrier-protein] dehydratase|nr:3-hydroxyacyl-ACP dehydratase [Bacteroidaceae bacterium]
MKLRDDLFKIKESEKTENGVRYGLTLNADHSIYKAHFPGQPITPGVCIIQIVTELAGDVLNQELFLKEIKNVKFLSVISPEDVKTISCDLVVKEIREDQYKVQATVFSEEIVYAKLSLQCQNRQ